MVPDSGLAPEAAGPVHLPRPASTGQTDAATGPIGPDDNDDPVVEHSDGIGDLLERIGHPDRKGRTAIIDDRASISYGRLADRSSRFGAGLVRAGVAPGDRVFLCLLDTMDWPMAFLGTLQVGAVPVCADTRLDAAAYETMLRDSQARLLVVSRALYPAFDGLLQRIESLARVEISEAPLADGGDMTVLLALDDVTEAPSRPVDAEICRLRDGARSQAWFDAATVETTDAGSRASVEVEATDRCLSTGRLCEPAMLEQVLLPTLAAGGSLLLIAEEEGAAAIRSRLEGHQPEHLEGKSPTLLFTTEQALHRLLADDGLPPLAGLPLRAIVLVDDSGDDGVADAAMGRTGIPVFRVSCLDGQAHPVVDPAAPAPAPAPSVEAAVAPDPAQAGPAASPALSCVYRPGRNRTDGGVAAGGPAKR